MVIPTKSQHIYLWSEATFIFGTENVSSQKNVGIDPNTFEVLNGHPNKIPTDDILGGVVQNCHFCQTVPFRVLVGNTRVYSRYYLPVQRFGPPWFSIREHRVTLTLTCIVYIVYSMMLVYFIMLVYFMILVYFAMLVYSRILVYSRMTPTLPIPRSALSVLSWVTFYPI